MAAADEKGCRPAITLSQTLKRRHNLCQNLTLSRPAGRGLNSNPRHDGSSMSVTDVDDALTCARRSIPLLTGLMSMRATQRSSLHMISQRLNRNAITANSVSTIVPILPPINMIWISPGSWLPGKSNGRLRVAPHGVTSS